jgi:kynurenine formamidase
LGRDKSFVAHKIFAKNNVLIVENLSNLEKIPTFDFDFIILPLKLKDATGSPVRAIAIY